MLLAVAELTKRRKRLAASGHFAGGRLAGASRRHLILFLSGLAAWLALARLRAPTRLTRRGAIRSIASSTRLPRPALPISTALEACGAAGEVIREAALAGGNASPYPATALGSLTACSASNLQPRATITSTIPSTALTAPRTRGIIGHAGAVVWGQKRRDLKRGPARPQACTRCAAKPALAPVPGRRARTRQLRSRPRQRAPSQGA